MIDWGAIGAIATIVGVVITIFLSIRRRSISDRADIQMTKEKTISQVAQQSQVVNFNVPVGPLYSPAQLQLAEALAGYSARLQRLLKANRTLLPEAPAGDDRWTDPPSFQQRRDNYRSATADIEEFRRIARELAYSIEESFIEDAADKIESLITQVKLANERLIGRSIQEVYESKDHMTQALLAVAAPMGVLMVRDCLAQDISAAFSQIDYVIGDIRAQRELHRL
ncbi:hypothetical protein [Paracoccus sp. S1E-3]|uniref:hypothetical protein n=2 Tax=Paracoccus TaxID=265 RepID=UPI0015EFB993|nr:hypothetical protein [Paracoccus sp. S1E-3]MBA4492268.1 hypothetical protein [Paracoccus sp. S1E-3]